VIGVQHRLLDGVTSGYGFSGIVTALFGGLHPLGTIPASFIFGGLLVGADKMHREVQVPSSLIQAILGLIVLFVVASQYWARRRSNRAPDISATPAAALGADEAEA
jgi:simple sugar transport system permease protein